MDVSAISEEQREVDLIDDDSDCSSSSSSSSDDSDAESEIDYDSFPPEKFDSATSNVLDDTAAELIKSIKLPSNTFLLTKGTVHTPIAGTRLYVAISKNTQLSVQLFNPKGKPTRSHASDPGMRKLERDIEANRRVTSALLDVAVQGKDIQYLDIFFLNGHSLIDRTLTQRLELLQAFISEDLPITTARDIDGQFKHADVLYRDSDLSAKFRYDYRRANPISMFRFNAVGTAQTVQRVKFPAVMPETFNLSSKHRKALLLTPTDTKEEAQKRIDGIINTKYPTEEERNKIVETGIELTVPSDDGSRYLIVADAAGAIFATSKLIDSLKPEKVDLATSLDMPDDLTWAKPTLMNQVTNIKWYPREARFAIDVKEPKYNSRIITLNRLSVVSDGELDGYQLNRRPLKRVAPEKIKTKVSRTKRAKADE